MKKVLSILLALCLLVGTLPMLASAADSDFDIEDGVLKKYNGSGGDVVIPEGVTSIGESAFIRCEGLTSVTIPDGVTSIGESAFLECSSLVSVTIPNSVTSVGKSAFSLCTSLVSVTIPDSVTNIGESAFFYCSSLTRVTIPNSATIIGIGAFSGCSSLTEIKMDSGNSKYASENGVLYTKDMTELITYPAGKQETSFTIPSSVTSIGQMAFWGCEGLTSVTIPGSVTSIGANAFRVCKGLTSVTIPDSVTSLGQYAFCGCSNLTSVTIPKGVTKIEDALFFGCDNLASVTILGSVTSVGGSAFSGCEELTSLTFPDGLEGIGEYAFYDCYKLATLTLPSSVTSIVGGAFFSSHVKDIYYGGTEEQWKKIKIGSSNDQLNKATIHYKTTPSTSFSDVDPSAYYADAVAWAVENKITQGTGEGKFSPDMNCTRDQIVTFLYRSKNSPEVTITNQFTDMPANEEFQKAISWAVQTDVTQGVGGGKFGPGQTCTRVQAVTFMWRAAGGPEPNSIATFSDMPSYSDFRKAISWAAENNITTGAGGNKFDPEGTCSRGQIVTFLYRAKNL